MDKRKYISDEDAEEIIIPDDNSSYDAWIQPEILRRCTSYNKPITQDLNDDELF